MTHPSDNIISSSVFSNENITGNAHQHSSLIVEQQHVHTKSEPVALIMPRLSKTASLRPHQFASLLNSQISSPAKAAQSAVRLHKETFQNDIIHNTFIHSIAGATGAMLSLILVYPLDNIRAQIQCSRQRKTQQSIFRMLQHIVKKDGIKALYSGLQSALIGVGISWGVFYYVYVLTRTQTRHWRNQYFTDINNLGISLFSGTVAAVVSNPIWVVNTRAKLRQNKLGASFFQTLADIIRQEGGKTLFAGLGAALILLLNPAIQFTLYEKLKLLLLTRRNKEATRIQPLRHLPPAFRESALLRQNRMSCDGAGGRRKKMLSWKSYLTNSNQKQIPLHSNQHQSFLTMSMFNHPCILEQTKLTSLDHFFAGSVSKLIALLLTYPLQVLKARAHSRTCYYPETGSEITTRSQALHKENNGTIRCFFRIIETEGVSGLYRGIQSKVLVSSITAAIMFV